MKDMMTNIYIETILPYAEYENNIFSYKINAKLKNGRSLIVIDDFPFILPIESLNLTNKNVSVLLNSHNIYIRPIDKNVGFETEFLGKIQYNNLYDQYFFYSDDIIVRIAEYESSFVLNRLQKYWIYEFIIRDYKNIHCPEN